ncbi:MAG: tRNA (adenosine(37)-N6)-threonylcarbamoyltransferase complex ATPase subunit type 1 TsaE [Planctomycetota bacterium]
MITIESASPEVTHAIGCVLGETLLGATRAEGGRVVRLSGELGAGKTALVRGIARGLGLEPRNVNSPTYTIANEYRSGDALMVHIDAYRVDDPEETLEQIDAHGALSAGAVLCIEWAELLGDAVGDADLDVVLQHAGERERTIVVDGPLVTDTLRERLHQEARAR